MWNGRIAAAAGSMGLHRGRWSLRPLRLPQPSARPRSRPLPLPLPAGSREGRSGSPHRRRPQGSQEGTSNSPPGSSIPSLPPPPGMRPAIPSVIWILAAIPSALPPKRETSRKRKLRLDGRCPVFPAPCPGFSLRAGLLSAPIGCCLRQPPWGLPWLRAAGCSGPGRRRPLPNPLLSRFLSSLFPLVRPEGRR